MSEFKDTTEDDDTEEEEKESKSSSSSEPTLNIFGYKIKVNDAQNTALVALALGVIGLGVNTFYPHLLPFNKQTAVLEDKDKKKKEDEEREKKTAAEKLPDNIEYPDLKMLDLNQPEDEDFVMADVVDRLYDDKSSIIDPNPRRSEESTLFGEEKRIIRKIPSLKIKKEEGFGLDLSEDLLT